jgi:hypothetical protein
MTRLWRVMCANHRNWTLREPDPRPPKRPGWWLMVLFAWDALTSTKPTTHKREDLMHRGD